MKDTEAHYPPSLYQQEERRGQNTKDGKKGKEIIFTVHPLEHSSALLLLPVSFPIIAWRINNRASAALAHAAALAGRGVAEQVAGAATSPRYRHGLAALARTYALAARAWSQARTGAAPR